MMFRAMLALALGLHTAAAFQAPARLTTAGRTTPLKSTKIATTMSYTSSVRRQGQRLMDDVSVGLFGGSFSNYDNGYDSDYYNNYNRGLGRGGYNSYDRPYGQFSRRSGGYSSYDRPYGQYSRRNGMGSYDRGFNSVGPYETGYNSRRYNRYNNFNDYDYDDGEYMTGGRMSRREGIGMRTRSAYGPNFSYDRLGGGGYDRYRMGGGSRGFGPYSSSYGGYGGGGGYDGYRLQNYGGFGAGNYPQYTGYSQYGGNSMGYNGMTQYGHGNQFGYGTSMY